MTEDKRFAKLTREYVESNKKFWDYLDQFFTRMRNGQITKKATKALNRTEIIRIKAMEKNLANIRKERLEELNRK